MDGNQRTTFRVGDDPHLEAELFHEGRVAPCRVVDLGAGGARVEADLQLAAGSQCTLGVRIAPELQDRATVPYVSFLMEVLETAPAAGGAGTAYRLRNTSAPGSPPYEAAAKLVFEAQRLQRAHETGADESSPMVSDHDRRRALGADHTPRFGAGSLRPDRPDRGE